MKTYKVTYDGNSKRFKDLEEIVDAPTARDAVIDVYSSYLDENFFPEEDGEIKDADGDTIAGSDDDYIWYDGGYFTAEEIAENE